ncbi:MAG: hypothetical protein WC824_09525 [Bacteroidota bacterium]|jgi:hypothetical protein
MPHEDNYTSTVDGAAGHAAYFFGWDRPSRYEDADPDYDGPDAPPKCAHCEEYEDDCNCEHGVAVETFSKAELHTARRDHADGRIKKGDKYRKIVTGGYHLGKKERSGTGSWAHSSHRPRWIRYYKILIKRAGE